MDSRIWSIPQLLILPKIGRGKRARKFLFGGGHSQKDNESMDVALVKTHMDFRDKMETQRQIYADLKKEFFRFLSKYM